MWAALAFHYYCPEFHAHSKGLSWRVQSKELHLLGPCGKPRSLTCGFVATVLWWLEIADDCLVCRLGFLCVEVNCGALTSSEYYMCLEGCVLRQTGTEGKTGGSGERKEATTSELPSASRYVSPYYFGREVEGHNTGLTGRGIFWHS